VRLSVRCGRVGVVYRCVFWCPTLFTDGVFALGDLVSEAIDLYGLIHARYILTPKGVPLMVRLVFDFTSLLDGATAFAVIPRCRQTSCRTGHSGFARGITANASLSSP
jgi:hypothetical protein